LKVLAASDGVAAPSCFPPFSTLGGDRPDTDLHAAARPREDLRGMSHRVIEDWRGEPVETLEDLLCPGLRAVCVGINPAPKSVAAGHYYQGQLGQAFFRRLRRAGLLPAAAGWEDDAAFAVGIGFTDNVKRPTASAKDLRAEELAHGKSILVSKLEAVQPAIVAFTFKKTATVVVGKFSGYGFIGMTLAHGEVFVMPGPYERADRVALTLAELDARWREL
jgi:double-stranded uracil-DNA glycosylase